jgi:hypothetical protein
MEPGLTGGAGWSRAQQIRVVKQSQRAEASPARGEEWDGGCGAVEVGAVACACESEERTRG